MISISPHVSFMFSIFRSYIPPLFSFLHTCLNGHLSIKGTCLLSKQRDIRNWKKKATCLQWPLFPVFLECLDMPRWHLPAFWFAHRLRIDTNSCLPMREVFVVACGRMRADAGSACNARQNFHNFQNFGTTIFKILARQFCLATFVNTPWTLRTLCAA